MISTLDSTRLHFSNVSENRVGMASRILDHDDRDDGIVRVLRDIRHRRSTTVGRLGTVLPEGKRKAKERIAHGRKVEYKTVERN